MFHVERCIKRSVYLNSLYVQYCTYVQPSFRWYCVFVQYGFTWNNLIIRLCTVVFLQKINNIVDCCFYTTVYCVLCIYTLLYAYPVFPKGYPKGLYAHLVLFISTVLYRVTVGRGLSWSFNDSYILISPRLLVQ